MGEYNPYRPPSSNVSGPQEAVPYPVDGWRQVPSSQALLWLSNGARLVTSAIGPWLLIGFVFFALAVALTFVPVVGPVLNQVLSVVLGAGTLLACYQQERRNGPSMNQLFAGFGTPFTALLIVSVATLPAVMLSGLIAFSLDGEAGFRCVTFGNCSTDQPIADATMLASAAGAYIVAMFLGYAPALVILSGKSPGVALSLSVVACWINLLPNLVFLAIALLLLWVGWKSLGLAFIFILPLLNAAAYYSFRDVFRRAAAPA